MLVLECVHAWRSLLPLYTKGNLTDYKIICHLSPFSGLQKWFYYLLKLTIMLPFTTTSLTTSVVWFSLGHFSCSFMSESLWPHRMQHTTLHCPSPIPGACSNLCPSTWWCHPIISSCFSLLLLPSIFSRIRVFANESVLHIRWPRYWSFWVSTSPSNEYSGLISFRMDGLDLLQSKGLSRVFSNTTVQKHKFFTAQLSLYSNCHIHIWVLEKTIALTSQRFVGKVMSLLFTKLSRLGIAFLPRSKHL